MNKRNDEENACLVARCENCGRIHVYFRKWRDGEKCSQCGGGLFRMLRVECRRKCTEFVAWKLSMQAIREKKKEDKNKFYSETKLKYYRRKAMSKKFGRKR